MMHIEYNTGFRSISNPSEIREAVSEVLRYQNYAKFVIFRNQLSGEQRAVLFDMAPNHINMVCDECGEDEIFDGAGKIYGPGSEELNATMDTLNIQFDSDTCRNSMTIGRDRPSDPSYADALLLSFRDSITALRLPEM